MAHSQGNYVKQRVAQFDVHEAVLLADLAENYQFVIWNEVQSYHWCKNYCTIHAIVIYMKDECNYLKRISTFFISDDLTKDTSFNQCMQK